MLNKRSSAGAGGAIEREAAALRLVVQQVSRMAAEQEDRLARYRNELSELERAEADHEAVIRKLQKDIADQQAELAEHDLLFAPEYQARAEHYKAVVNAPMTEEAGQIVHLLQSLEYRGIVVYPHAVRWEPVQRPQHLLMEFARKGFLCFFCDAADTFSIREIEESLFVVTQQEHLLQALQTSHVLVINSFLMQNSWFDALPHKTVWYDVLDRIDFFSLYDRNMLAKHYEMLHTADIVTYSAHQLKEYVGDREDAVYLPNASRQEDFKFSGDTPSEMPDDLKPIVRKNKRIIGYYGAIEEWFDTKLVKSLARDPGIEIVLIGHCGIAAESFPANIHFLGPKPYLQLKDYAACFDALIIPFIVNKLTNAVSPVKFFEYCTIGKPIITTPIAEVVPFAGPGIKFVKAGEKVKLSPSFWKVTPEARAHLKSISDKNQWSKRAELVLNELEARPSCLNLFANRTYNNHVGVFAATFFDYEGGNYYSGGAERYLVDLHEACGELGLKLDIYQYGHFPWYRKYNDIDVYSLGHESLQIHEFSLKNLNAFNRRYLYAADGKLLLNFYSAFFQAHPDVAHPSIGISHGVAWDQPGCEYTDGEQFWRVNERFIQSAKQVQKMISVDTNTANWFQTLAYGTGQRMQTIPNYVDPNEFYPVPRQDDGKVRIVYPRRLYEARGLYITLAAAEQILRKFPETEFHFVGKGFEEDLKAINKAMERWPDRIFCYHREPDDMHLVYKEADIVLIPTLYSEGTSLSCLEACATGNAIISTRIGGLTDIIIDRFNGLLINPDSKSLEQAIVECLENPELRERLGRNALEVSKAFNKVNWKERWKAVIVEMVGDLANGDDAGLPSTEAVEFRLGPDADTGDWMPEAVQYLQQGKAVFIRGGSGLEPESSFGRLQWITEETELYFNPIMKRFD